MIKRIQLDDWSTLESQLETLQQKSYTHFIIEDSRIEIDEDMLEAVQLQPQTMIVDYAVDGVYLNESQCFSTAQGHFNAWMNNNNHYPNVIFHIETALGILKDYHVDHLFDLALLNLLDSEAAVDSHVVFNFTDTFTTSAGLWDIIQEHDYEPTTQMLLNVLAYEHRHSLPYRSKQTEVPEDVRPEHLWLRRFGFKAPHFLYNIKQQRALKQFKNEAYIYEKDTSKVQDHIVVLGPNYQFRGNTRYLFNYLAKHNSKTPVYFITNDVKGPNFLTPETKETVKMIESAKVVILEDLIPSDLQPNGKIIQLWHGTPIQRRFLDRYDALSMDAHDRAIQFNKWRQQDYLVCDTEASEPYFETAFPSQHLDFVTCGYPRVRYLFDKVTDKPYLSFIRQELKLDSDKPTLLYVPSRHTGKTDDALLPISDGLVNKYNVIYRPHPESEGPDELEHAISAPNNLETQDLILVADVVLTDYASLIFDALATGKTVCQYTPNQDEIDKHSGVYDDVMQSLSTVRYSDAKAFHNDLISHQMTELKSNPYVRETNPSYEQIGMLIQSIMKR